MKTGFYRLIFPALVPFLSFAQTVMETPASTPAPPQENHYQFQLDTAWGKVSAMVGTQADRFRVEVESAALVSGWVLKEEASSHLVSKGGMSPDHRLQFQVPRPFQGSYRLTLYLVSGREQELVALRLLAAQEKSTPNAMVEGLEEFQDDPNHPYHTMVKSLYREALESYSKGDLFRAINDLRKAEELDPLQPQVQALLRKALEPTEKPAGPLDKIRETWKKGKKMEALAQLEDYLDEHPEDREALALKEEMEERHRSATKKAVPPVKKATPAKTPLPQNDPDRQAKADQAYNLGLESYGKGDLAVAKKFWEETLEIDPTHLQARHNLERLKEQHPELNPK